MNTCLQSVTKFLDYYFEFRMPAYYNNVCMYVLYVHTKSC